MGMITQNTTVIQAATPEYVFRFLCEEPIIVHDGKARAYILINDLLEETESFILTGLADANELHVLPDAVEKALVNRWRSLGFECKYGYQQIEYMKNCVTIKYLRVINPETGFEISLIPWFMLPGRPYPVFIYAFANWHYVNSKQKSMRLSAAATSRIFGISDFNKATVSRSIKSMEQLFSNLQIDKPLSINETDMYATTELIERIPEILSSFQVTKALKKTNEYKCVQLPPPIRRVNNIQYVFSHIPNELSIVFNNNEVTRKGISDKRKRPARQRAKKTVHVQRYLKFVESQRLKHIRVEFIAACKAIVMDAVVTYHRFLI